MSHEHRITVVSFDIGGTLEVGDSPGRIDLARVRHALTLGYVVGSCSDRTLRDQQEIWEDASIEVHLTALKHRLDEVRERFPAHRYVHFGDTDVPRNDETTSDRGRSGAHRDEELGLRLVAITVDGMFSVMSGQRPKRIATPEVWPALLGRLAKPREV